MLLIFPPKHVYPTKKHISPQAATKNTRLTLRFIRPLPHLTRFASKTKITELGILELCNQKTGEKYKYDSFETWIMQRVWNIYILSLFL